MLVRLLTGVPEADFAKAVQGLSVLLRDEGAGVVDRLITDDYTREDLDVLTLDKAMASLPRVRILHAETA
ncbi:MAG: hypothetical protein OXK74_10620 [Gemmatimonadota bacterium]|nr:hypothetical protein [Gemmatimonadota bacterium]